MISAEFARTDPFSSIQWSERQTGYARATNLGEYTPQMVIGGGSQCGGSDAGSLQRAVATARSTPQLGRTSIETNLAAERLQIKISAQRLSVAATGSRMVMVAIYEKRVGQQDWRRREWRPRDHLRLHPRKLLPAFKLDAARRASLSREITIDLDASWSVKHLGVAAFIQDPTSLRIEGASSEYPIASN